MPNDPMSAIEEVRDELLRQLERERTARLAAEALLDAARVGAEKMGRALSEAIEHEEQLECGYRDLEPCGHPKHYLMGDDWGNFLCVVCERDGWRLKSQQLEQERDSLRTELKGMERRLEIKDSALQNLGGLYHDSITGAPFGKTAASGMENTQQAYAQVPVDAADYENVESMLDVGERVVLPGFPDMRGAVESIKGSGVVKVKWDDGTLGHHCIIDLVCEDCYDDGLKPLRKALATLQQNNAGLQSRYANLNHGFLLLEKALADARVCTACWRVETPPLHSSAVKELRFKPDCPICKGRGVVVPSACEVAEAAVGRARARSEQL